MNSKHFNQYRKKITGLIESCRKFLIIIIILIVLSNYCFVLPSLQATSLSLSTPDSVPFRISEQFEVTTPQYSNLGPILIEGNDEFRAQATAEGWPGEGTLSMPYVIEKLPISGSSDTILIHIRYTDLFFRLQHCSLRGGELAISLVHVTNGYIFNNTISDGGPGIILWGSDDNVIINNIVRSNTGEAIGLHSSSDNLVTGNNVYDNNAGILLWEDSEDNVIINNTAYNNNIEGIGLHAAKNNIISGNRVYDNLAGILVWEFSDFNQLLKNKISFNSFGITIKSNDNIIFGNSVYYNDGLGLEIEQKFSGNNIEGNNFMSNNLGDPNPHQAYDEGSDNVFEYNYWDDWTTPDANDDGIVDIPCTIDGGANNQDLYPLTTLSNQTIFHALFLPNIIYPNRGEALKDTITIQWMPSYDTLGHTITYSVYYSSDSGKSWTLLASGLSTTSYNWDTSTVVDSSTYLIKVVATCSEDLTKEDVLNSTLPDLTLLTLLTIIIIVVIIISTFGFLTWRYRQRRKPITVPYSIEIPSRIEKPVVQKEFPKSQPIICPACKFANKNTSKWCTKCEKVFNVS
ncbi:MAG: NosD domain-containing protein [Candidatus Hodarchaeales archaeon]|jgi:parallel beta-helix repeat protein